MKVLSHYERIVLKKLFSIMKALMEKHNLSLTLEKPLFDIDVGEDLFCRPPGLKSRDRD